MLKLIKFLKTIIFGSNVGSHGNKSYDLTVEDICGFNMYVCDEIFSDIPAYKEFDVLSMPLAATVPMDVGEGMKSYIVFNTYAIGEFRDDDILNFMLYHEQGHVAQNHNTMYKTAIDVGVVKEGECCIDLEVSADVFGYCNTPDKEGFIRGMRKLSNLIPRELEFVDRMFNERIQMVNQLTKMVTRLS